MRTPKIIGTAAAMLSVCGCGSGMSDQEAAAAYRSGEMCVIGGFNDSFLKAVKAQLRDPNSLEVIETRVDPVGPDGTHRIGMRFRSRNGFGGMNELTAIGTVDGTCSNARVTMLG
jgi:hypothetical protein